MKTEFSLENVREFLTKAIQLGKYKPGTGAANSAALKIIERGLQDEEPRSLEYISQNALEIIARQPGLNLSEASVKTYVTRIRTLVNDFMENGTEPAKIYSWQKSARLPSVKKPQQKENIQKSIQRKSDDTEIAETTNSDGVHLHTLKWRLRPNLSIQIQLPVNLNKNDVVRLKKMLDFEVELTKEEDDES